MHQLIEKLKAKVERKSTATTLRGLMAAARRTNVIKVLPNGGTAWNHVTRPPWYTRPIQAPRALVVPLRRFTQWERDIRRAKNDVVFRRRFVAATRRRIAAMTPGEWFLAPVKAAKLAEELAPTNLGFKIAPKVWPEARAVGNAAFTYAHERHRGCRVGSEHYSGCVEYVRDFTPSGEGKAWTRTYDGDNYPGSYYCKTSATHCILFSYPEVERMMKMPPSVVEASTRDYAPIIGCLERHTRSAKVRVVVRHRKKQQKDHVEWIAWQDDVVYHAATKGEAEQGLREKVAAAAGYLAAQTRRRNGVAPLYQFEVDIDTVRRLTGWCVVGCQRWVRAHLGRDTDKASWSEVAAAARKDMSAYGNTLLALLGASRNPSSAAWINTENKQK